MAGYNLSLRAIEKLDKIYEYSIENFGEHQADKYYFSMHDAFDLLAQQPKLGRIFRRYRRHEHAEHIIFYKELNDGILIVEVLHKHEDIDGHLL